jgi:small subunit ribosomal protein S21
MNYHNPAKGCTVFVKNDNVDQAIRKLKKKVQDSGILQELRERECYEKPTSVRKRKAGAAKQRLRKRIQSEQLPKKLY